MEFTCSESLALPVAASQSKRSHRKTMILIIVIISVGPLILELWIEHLNVTAVRKAVPACAIIKAITLLEY
jgi:hypothetical protein